MKKCAAYLLLLISMAATLYPCYGKDDCCNDMLTSSNTSHDNHKSEGSCSPFITCNTCPGFTQMVTVIDIPFVQEQKPVHHSKVVSFVLSTYKAPLLQPPRVA
jgi:hypothetical protein